MPKVEVKVEIHLTLSKEEAHHVTYIINDFLKNPDGTAPPHILPTAKTLSTALYKAIDNAEKL